VITNDCPVGVAAWRKQLAKVGAMATAAFGAVFGVVSYFGTLTKPAVMTTITATPTMPITPMVAEPIMPTTPVMPIVPVVESMGRMARPVRETMGKPMVSHREKMGAIAQPPTH
jgi:hypothetical protein